MTVIADIRIYRCTVKNVTGVTPEGFASKELCAVARRICMKLRENKFSMGDFDHLYINLSTCLPVGEVNLPIKPLTNITRGTVIMMSVSAGRYMTVLKHQTAFR